MSNGNDDWIMGQVAAQDQYQPLGNDPWTGLMPGQKDLPLDRPVFDIPKVAGAVMGGLAEDVATPGRLAQPNPYPEGSEAWQYYENQKTDIGEKWSRGMALNFAGTGMPFAQKGAVGVFGGRLAQTADLGALAKAEEMATKGSGPYEIRAQTGWHQGADGKWRFEIPDQSSRWKDNPEQFTNLSPQGTRPHSTAAVALGSVFEHPDLFAAYPELAGIEFKPAYLGSGMKAQYMRGHPEYGIEPSIMVAPMGPGAMRSSTLHELQHGVQDIEGFATGGNTYGLTPGTPAWDIYQERLKAIRTPTPEAELQKAGILGPEYTYADYLREHQQTIKNDALGLDRAAQDYAVQEAYRRLAGEVEARNVQKRLDYPPERLVSEHPNLSQDVLTKQQIIKYREPRMGDIARPY